MAGRKESEDDALDDADEHALSSAQDYDREIAEHKRKIRALEEKKAAAEFSKTALCKHLKAIEVSLAKALEDMDGRANVLSAAFIRASRQYHTLLERQIDEGLGKKRRGRKPKSDLG